MAGGMEMMINALLKSAGFNPKELQEGMQGFIQHVYGKLDEFEARTRAIELQLTAQTEAIQGLMKAINNLATRTDHHGTINGTERPRIFDAG